MNGDVQCSTTGVIVEEGSKEAAAGILLSVQELLNIYSWARSPD